MATTPHRRALQQAQQQPDPSTPKTYAITSIDATLGLTPPFSLSASAPFDWAAARGERPPPYGNNSPDNRLAAKKAPSSTGTPTTGRKRVFRKESLLNKIQNYPSHLLFELSLIPQNLPLPESKTFGRAAGVLCHVLTVFTGYMAAPVKSEFDAFGDEWSDLRGELAGSVPDPYLEYDSGWSVAWLCGWLLLIASFANALYVFTRFRIYHLNLRTKSNAIKSPNARFVKRKRVSPQEESTSSILYHFLSIFGRQLRMAWRFLWGSTPLQAESDSVKDVVQALAMWFPGEFELALLSVYSPVHALLHSMLVRQYWPRWTIITVLLTVLLDFLITFYTQLVKDTKILAAEVMYEYNEGFVHPTINVVRKDACVMTNEAEIVDIRPPRQGLPAVREPVPQRAILGQGKTYQCMQQEKLQDSSSKIARPRHTVAGITPGGLLRL